MSIAHWFSRVLLLVLLMSFFLHPSVLKALSISPAYQDIQLNNFNEVAVAKLKIENPFEYAISLKLLPVFYDPIKQLPLISFDQSGVLETTNIPKYIEISTPELEIAGNSSSEVEIEITANNHLLAGGNTVAILAYENQLNESENNSSLIQGLISILFINYKVDEKVSLSLNKVKGWSWPIMFFKADQLQLEFANNGNSFITPRGKIEITDIFGRIIATGIINMDSQKVFSGSSKIIEVPISHQNWTFPVSIFQISLKGSAGTDETAFSWKNWSTYFSFWFFLVLLTIIFLFLTFKYQLRKKINAK